MKKYLLLILNILLISSCSTQSKPQAGFETESIRQPASIIDVLGSEDYEIHVKHSRKLLADNFGVAIELYDNFFNGLKGELNWTFDYELNCADALESNRESREKLLSCLAKYGRSAMHEKFFQKLFDYRIYLTQNEDPNENLLAKVNRTQTIQLLSYLEDVVRDLLIAKWNLDHLDLYVPKNVPHAHYQWYSPKAKESNFGFLPISRYQDFDFEDGDIVLSIGETSISAMIPLVTKPQRRFSHAFMMRVRNGSKKTIEAIIEKGVIKDRYSNFPKHNYRHLLVMRLKPEIAGLYTREERDEMLRLASDIANAQVGQPYNMKMDVESDLGFFCSQLVIDAYMKAAKAVLKNQKNLDQMQDLMNTWANFDQGNIHKFISQIGVNPTVKVPSPGDIVSSPFIDVVAEYKANQFAQWSGLMATHAFIERIQSGYDMSDKTLLGAIATPVAMTDKLLKKVLGKEWGFVPQSVSVTALRTIIAYELSVYKPVKEDVLGYFKKKARATLFHAPLWELRAQASYAFVSNNGVKKQMLLKTP